MKKTYTTVDLLKFIFCLCIIALHTNLLNSLPNEVSYYISHLFFRLAVPFFFVTSGFFLRKKYSLSDPSEHKTVLLNYIKRLLFPLLFFEIITVIQSIITQNLNGSSPFSITINVIQQIIFNPYGALWFVQALIVSAILIYPILKHKNGVNICIVIGVVLYCFALICNSYFFIVEGTPLQSVVEKYIYYCITARNGVFMGIIFMSLGMKCFDIHNSILKSPAKKKLIIPFMIAAWAVYCLEIVVLHINHAKSIDESSLFISHLLLVPLLLLSSVLYSVGIPQNISVYLRNLSTGMYFLHRPILWFVVLWSDNVIVTFLIVVLVSFAICSISYKIDSKRPHKYHLLK